jgi:Na+/H+ antiporter NhaD/arsenite permease-like protein
MLAAAVLSRTLTGKTIYAHNQFNYAPIREVAILFVAIFSTMAPALEFLTANAERMPLKTPGQFYFASGSLSAVLDNAPTYLTFLQLELGKLEKARAAELEQARAHIQKMRAEQSLRVDPEPRGEVGLALEAMEKYHGERVLRGETTDDDVEIAFLLGVPTLNAYVVAISLGSVFFGACTYIGNGPNFMVKSIADAAGVQTPDFIAYILRYTLTVLAPVYVLVWLVFLL